MFFGVIKNSIFIFLKWNVKMPNTRVGRTSGWRVSGSTLRNICIHTCVCLKTCARSAGLRPLLVLVVLSAPSCKSFSTASSLPYCTAMDKAWQTHSKKKNVGKKAGIYKWSTTQHTVYPLVSWALMFDPRDSSRLMTLLWPSLAANIRQVICDLKTTRDRQEIQSKDDDDETFAKK